MINDCAWGESEFTARPIIWQRRRKLVRTLRRRNGRHPFLAAATVDNERVPNAASIVFHTASSSQAPAGPSARPAGTLFVGFGVVFSSSLPFRRPLKATRSK